MAYRTNRFQATRFGLHGNYVDPAHGRIRLSEHLRMTFDRLMPVARGLGTSDLLEALRDEVLTNGGDCNWLRAQYNRGEEIAEVVEAAVGAWRGEAPAQGEPRLPDMPARRRVRASSEPILNLDGMKPFAFKRLGAVCTDPARPLSRARRGHSRYNEIHFIE